MRSAHHFGSNKGYHHVVAFLTIAHRNPLIKWALCGTSYKRACYTIVGSNNNTRRGQLSKRSQSHRGRGPGGRFGGGAPWPVWQNVASSERRGNGWEEAFGNERQGRKKTSSQKQLSMTVKGQMTGERKTLYRLNRGPRLLSPSMSWMSDLLACASCCRNINIFPTFCYHKTQPINYGFCVADHSFELFLR